MTIRRFSCVGGCGRDVKYSPPDDKESISERLVSNGGWTRDPNGILCNACVEEREVAAMPWPAEPVPPELTLSQVVKILSQDTRYERDDVVFEQGRVIAKRYQELSAKRSFDISSRRAREEWLVRWLATKGVKS